MLKTSLILDFIRQTENSITFPWQKKFASESVSICFSNLRLSRHAAAAADADAAAVVANVAVVPPPFPSFEFYSSSDE